MPWGCFPGTKGDFLYCWSDGEHEAALGGWVSGWLAGTPEANQQTNLKYRGAQARENQRPLAPPQETDVRLAHTLARVNEELLRASQEQVQEHSANASENGGGIFRPPRLRRHPGAGNRRSPRRIRGKPETEGRTTGRIVDSRPCRREPQATGLAHTTCAIYLVIAAAAGTSAPPEKLMHCPELMRTGHR